jgi:hypothetical protein
VCGESQVNLLKEDSTVAYNEIIVGKSDIKILSSY